MKNASQDSAKSVEIQTGFIIWRGQLEDYTNTDDVTDQQETRRKVCKTFMCPTVTSYMHAGLAISKQTQSAIHSG